MICPTYIPLPSGNLFTLLVMPEGGGFPRHWVIHVPAFAEEMNKSRKMVREQARILARSGMAVMIPDLYGTGDSEGDFGSADWDCWKRNINDLIVWLSNLGAESFSLWGLRLGTLLALDVLTDGKYRGLNSVTKVLLWQPLPSGRQFMKQFFRLRMVADMIAPERQGGPLTVSGLREQSLKGESVEVAGYELLTRMVSQIETLELKSLAPPLSVSVSWFEVVSSNDSPMSPVSRNIIDAWSNGRLNVCVSTVVEPKFWASQEIVMAPSLLDVTAKAVLSDKTTGSELIVEGSGQGEAYKSGELSPIHTHDFEDEFTRVHPFIFLCMGEELCGIVHHTQKSTSKGVLLVVGGPQYRVGSHRQFVLLARTLAEAGIAVFRFDYRGMGDSRGEFLGFEGVSEDIQMAIDAFQKQVPEVKEVVIWGLCDAATAASFYASGDERVIGLVLLNPWVRSEEGEARAYLKYYYLRRVLDPELWKKIRQGNFNIRQSLGSLRKMIWNSFSKGSGGRVNPILESCNGSLLERLELGLGSFQGKVLLILSGNDLTAAEFKDSTRTSKSMKNIINRPEFTIRELERADHTFSRREWRDQVSTWTAEWVKSL